jgi:hypothetical protein
MLCDKIELEENRDRRDGVIKMEEALELVGLSLQDLGPEDLEGYVHEEDFHPICGHFHAQGSPCPVDVPEGCGDYRCCINY